MKKLIFVAIALFLAVTMLPVHAQKGAGEKPSSRKQTSKKQIPLPPVQGSSDLKAYMQNSPGHQQFPYANAIILLDEKTCSQESDGTFVVTEHQVIKILTPQGARRFAEIKIPYSANDQTVTMILLRTMTTDGQVLSPPREAYRDVVLPILKESPHYAFIKVKAVPVPGLGDSSIVEYIAAIRQKPRFGSHFWRNIFVQDPEPVLESRLQVTVPKGKNLAYGTRNVSLSPVVKEGPGGAKVYVWSIKNAMPLYWEPAMPSIKDVAAQIRFTTIGDWNAIASWLGKEIQKKAQPDAAIKAKAESLLAGKMSGKEKIRTIYNFVSGSLRFVAVELGMGGYEPRPASEILKSGYGDGKDQTTLLISLLQAAGFQANPVLVSTALNGKLDKSLPSPDQFDHVVVQVLDGGQALYLDPTADTCSFGDLPADDQGREVLVLSGEKGDFSMTPIFPASNNREEIRASVEILSDGGINQQLEITEYGVNNTLIRYVLKGSQQQDRLGFFQQLAKQICPQSSVTSHAISDLSNADPSVSLKMNFTGKNYTTQAEQGNLMLFRVPLTPSRKLAQMMSIDPKDRRYPFVIGNTLEETKELEITIPREYAVKYLPESITYETKVGSYRATFRREADRIRFASKFTLNTPEVSVENYGELKNLLERAVKTEEDRIVLEKRKGSS